MEHGETGSDFEAPCLAPYDSVASVPVLTNNAAASLVYPVMTGEATVATANHDAGAAADRLGALFDAHHQRLYRLARRMSRSADEARDLVQDTFLRAARAPGIGSVGRVRRRSVAGAGAGQSLSRQVAADGDSRAAAIDRRR